MAVIVATIELVECTGLGAITIYTEAGDFGQSLLSTVATVHYIHPVSLLRMRQLHQGLLPIVVIKSVRSIWYESYSVEL